MTVAGSADRVLNLVSVERADVYKAGRLAGGLTRERDAVIFEYVPGYLADDAAPPVAATLPKSDEEVRAEAGAVPPFFAGLLPEGARLGAITSAVRTSVDDQLTLLLAVGSDTIGDVQVVPAGERLASVHSLFDPDQAAKMDFSAVFARALSVDPALLESVALPGVQVKVSAALVSTPLGTTAGPAILKLNPPNYPRLAENEHFFLAMAQACGLPVPRHQLIYDSSRNAGLLVERFDRTLTADGIYRSLPQEDACQIMGRYPAAKYRVTLQDVAVALATAVAAGGGSRPLALRRTLEIAAFSYLIGNGDMHAKNLSVRQAPSGLWEVTPAYDLLSTQPYLSWQDPMALGLYGRANKLTRRWWLDAAGKLQLPQKSVSRALDRIVSASGSYVARLGDIGFNDENTARLRHLIETRRHELSS